MGQEGPRASRRVRGRWGWRGRGHSDRELPQRERAGEQCPVAVGGQVVAVVRGVENHDQRTTVVVTDLFTDRTPVLSGNVDNDDIGRRSTPGQLQRCLDHVDCAVFTEQSEQLDTRPHASVQQGHALLDLWCWHLSSLGGLVTSDTLRGGPQERPGGGAFDTFALVSWRQARYPIERFLVIRRYMRTSALPAQKELKRQAPSATARSSTARLLGRPSGY